MSMFQRATRSKVYLKLALMGPSGSGKTYSALKLAEGLANGGKIAVLDTENGSASLYAEVTEFDVVTMVPPFDPKNAIAAIDAAVAGGYSVLIIDSATHFWKWILEFKASLDSRGGNQYTNWDKAKPYFERLKMAMLQAPIHIVACLRAKDDYVLETNAQGKQAPKKVGMGAIMEPGAEYEYTVVFELGMDHGAVAGTDGRGKDRTGLFADSFAPITVETGKRLVEWLNTGAEPVAEVPDPAAITKRWGLDAAAGAELRNLAKRHGQKLSEALVTAATESVMNVRDAQAFADWLIDSYDPVTDGEGDPKAENGTAETAADSVATAPEDAETGAGETNVSAKKSSPAKTEEVAA